MTRHYAPRIIACACCDQIGPIEARGLIADCYERHRYRGTLDDYPTRQQLIAAELATLDRGQPTLRSLAARLGVSTRTIQRHRARQRQEQEEVAA